MVTKEKTVRMMEIEDAAYDLVSAEWIKSHAGLNQTRDEADKDYHTNFNRLVEELLSKNAEYQAI